MWPVASMFDTVASEYGWTDDEMLDVTLSRMRIAVKLITQRKREEAEFALLIAEIHAKSIVSALSGLAQTKKGSKQIAKFADHLSFIDKPQKRRKVPSTESVERLFGDGRPNR